MRGILLTVVLVVVGAVATQVVEAQLVMAPGYRTRSGGGGASDKLRIHRASSARRPSSFTRLYGCV